MFDNFYTFSLVYRIRYALNIILAANLGSSKITGGSIQRRVGTIDRLLFVRAANAQFSRLPQQLAPTASA